MPPPKRDLPPYVHQTGPNTYEYRVNQPRRADGTGPKPVRKGGFPDPYGAHRAALAARRHIGIATPDEVEASGMTLGEWCAEWLNQHHDITSSTRFNYRRSVNLVRGGRLATTRIDRLTPMQLRRWMDELAREWAPTTIKGVRTVISVALNRAMKLSIIPSNPTRHVSVPQHKRRVRVILTPPQAERFLQTARSDAHPA